MVDRAKKISELPSANSISPSDYVVVVQDVGTANVVTRRATVNNILTPIFYNANTTGTSYTPNRTNGSVQQITASNNFTLNVPSNMSAGQTLTLVITQDNTGSRLMTPNSSYKFANSSKTLSTAAGSIDKMNILCANSTVFLVELHTGYST